PELIEANGYPVEIHHLTSEDGYILELHRIPHGRSGPSENRPVAYFEHCLLCSSSDYLMNEPEKAIGYMMADAGYDVWLSNMRGNTYSRNHTTLNPEDVEFWKFSWDEMARYDVPASIDYVLGETGADGVYYVGWSMGTSVFWALMSDKPEYNDKIKAMAAMAPVAYTENTKGIMRELAPFSHDIDLMTSLLGVGEVLPSNELMDYMAEHYCAVEDQYVEVCYNFLFLLSGPDPDQIPKEFLPLIVSHMPAGTSVHTILHFEQQIPAKKFQMYDFGAIGNLEHYDQDTPPIYNLSRVTAPVGLFWGNTDWLADPTGYRRRQVRLPTHP
ncbi:Lipase 3-like 1, partial [Homarus americanus]